MRSSILLGVLGLPLALTSTIISKRDCKSIDFDGRYKDEGYTKPHETTFMVSQPINCTAALAKSAGDPDRCEFEHYAEGIEIHSTLNITGVADPQPIFELVKKSTKFGAGVDMNETIVMNYTFPMAEGYTVNFTGWYGFTPYLQCYEGTLHDCDGDDKDAVEGVAITACGAVVYYWSDDLGKIGYSGETHDVVGAVDYSKYANMTEPQPRYDDVKGNATASRTNAGSPTSAVRMGMGGVWGGTMLAVAWAVYWAFL